MEKLKGIPEHIIAAMSDVDPDQLLSSNRYRGSIADQHKLKLNFFPRLEDICGVKSITYRERRDKMAKEKEAMWRYEQGESSRYLKDKGMLHLASPKSKSAWRELYMELKRREVVVDEYYRLRYEKEMINLRKENEALRCYIGRYDPNRKYPESVDLEKAITKYFRDCDKKKPKKQAYTVPDLLLFLRLTKSQWRGILQNGPGDYRALAEMAMLKIEGQRNQQLLTGKGQMSGHIADLNHHFDWNDSGETASMKEKQSSVTNNIMIVGAPPTPKSIEEWTDWYQKSVGSSSNKGQGREVQAIDVEHE